MLLTYLENKRYVVVLDDVWDAELWNKIKVALPNSQNGCRVIIVTQKEDIAAKSFERSLLQVVEVDIYGLPGTCRMHDMLRELARSKSEEEKFCALYDERIGGTREEGVIRRLSIQESQLLRVLDLQGAPIETFPDHIVTLFNLTYLNLKRTWIKKLPESIGRLYNLETLDLRRSQVGALPNGIVNLKNLKYCLSGKAVIGTQFPPNLNTLNNLQFLGYVEANSTVLKEIRSMAQLVRLYITNNEVSDEEDLCIAVQNMPLLRRLSVWTNKKEQILRLDALKSPPPFLEKLTLSGKLENIPHWFRSLQNLRHLTLHFSRLTDDLPSHLEALPNLRRISLFEAYEGLHLEFKNGFPSLESLVIYNFPNLQSISVAKGVMPGIKELSIEECRMLKEVPSGIKYLTKLQELALASLAADVIKRIEEPSGVDRPNVRHIPKITYSYQASWGWSRRNISSFFDSIRTEKGLDATDISEEANSREEEEEDSSGGNSDR
ncbi:hypothetical protein Tsubulata_007228 [Turnera subulata]|uniref:NB-ARC domain-containing protein n=1 Tax=Turnera subulata TaxID=218843 RepID=A0A9Q0FK34_9ROSI|nr:hypothetical protein Tsubulata_007228 [Turnera subulata]